MILMTSRIPFLLASLCFILLLNLYVLQFDASKTISNQENILSLMNSAAERTPAAPPTLPCVFTEVRIRLKEMTGVLDARNDTKEAIFLTETSGSGVIKARFICGVESAARASPMADVYLLVAYSGDELRLELNEPLQNVLRHYPNVQALYIDMDLLFQNTPLETFYQSGKLENSKFKAAHASDLIRVVALWKYGGKYLDMDIVLVRSLSGLDNFIIDESQLPNNYIANGAFAFEKHSIVGDYMFEIIRKEFNGDEWAYNGPRVITDAMRRYTGADMAANMTKQNLKKFTKLKYETLFPIQYYDLLLYFDESKSDSTMQKIAEVPDLIGFHIGNNLINNEIVNVGSKQPYSLIAQQYCPRAYWSAYTVF